ncbi:MAG: hypothetical protein IAE78_08300 [Myxococcus sp.]|nr:hypothetical protein [Myxococcus sp.]
MRRLPWLASLVLLSCTPAPMGAAQLEFRASANSVDIVKGAIVLTAVATDPAGNIGRGTVEFVTEAGAVSVPSVELDEFGKGQVEYSCLESDDPLCGTLSAAEVTAIWQRSPKVTATRRVSLRRPGAFVTSADGGSGAPCMTQAECQSGLACFDGTCVGSGRLRFSLSWMAQSDFDLHVLTPSGKHLFYGNRRDDGGELDVDACIVASACRPTNVENIFWFGTPPSGTYTFYVHNYNGRQGGPFRIQVAGGSGAPQEFSGTLPASRTESMRFTITR